MVRGEDQRPVKPNRIAKSISIEDTYEIDIKEPEHMLQALKDLTERLAKRLEHKGKEARTISIKIKYADFTQITRSKTLLYYVNTTEDIMRLVEELFTNLTLQDKRVRLLGVVASNFYDSDLEKYSSTQLRLFD